MTFPEMGEFPVRDQLPVSYYRDIGRVIFHWARLENELKDVIYTLLSIGRIEGRIAVSTPRADQIVERIADLLSIKGLKTKVKLKEYQSAVQILRVGRDTIAHGIWVDHSGSKNPVLQRVRGSISPKPGQKKASARIFPGALDVEPGDLRKTAQQIEHLIGIALALKEEMKTQTQGPQQESP